jgi:hypothetical protein
LKKYKICGKVGLHIIDVNMKLTLLIGLTFSPIAGLMSFIINYEEYKHHFPDRKIPFRMAIRDGIFAFTFFMVLSLFIGLFLVNMFR